MRKNTCCFTGHRYIDDNELEEIRENLRVELIKLIEQGVCYFGCGGALGFDTMAALIVLELKKIYSQIRLIMVLPCKEQSKDWRIEDIEIYQRILKQADKIVYTSEHYYRGCMHKRNRYLVDNSDCCICYLARNSGGTAYTVQYATKSNIPIINVKPEIRKR